MKLKRTMLIMWAAGLAGCNSIAPLKTEALHPYASPEELIAKRGLNQPDGSAKAYIYLWDKAQQHLEPQSLAPRTSLSQYCHSRDGKFSLLYKSQLTAVKNTAQKNRLSKNRHVTQGIGAYQCTLPHNQQWVVSIEPVSEQQQDKNSSTRVVYLLSKTMTLAEAEEFYREVVVAPSKKDKPVTEKAPIQTGIKETDKKELEKKNSKLPTTETAATVVAAPRVNRVDTPQQQQMKLYVAARRDMNSGKNLNNACNNAQRAYNYGKLQGTEGTRVYTESGMLVARCLSNIPAYTRRFPNANDQAKRILQNLANDYNHAGAKNMLRQLK